MIASILWHLGLLILGAAMILLGGSWLGGAGR